MITPFILSAYVVQAADPNPLPRQEISLDLSGDTARSLEDSSRVIGHQGSSSVIAAFVQREQISGPVYWTWGVHNEIYTFSHTNDFSIHQLQTYAAEFALQYVTDSQVAAYIRIRPGVYFENHPDGSFDIPVEAVTGIPIVSSLNGVAGVSNGRFYHHAVPIAGLAWTINDRMSLNAVYPQPSFVVKINPQLLSSFGGELNGDGFKVDSYGPDSRIEYYDYRIGETLSYKFQPSWTASAGAGYEWMRVFDLYRNDSSPEAHGGLFLHLGLTYAR